MNKNLLSNSLFWVSLIFVACVPASRKLIRADQAYQKRFQEHVGFLASDSLEGRRTGTRGEVVASKYITSEFLALGLEPKGTDGFLQRFEVNEGKKASAESFLSINKDTLRVEKDYFFFP